MGVPESLSGVSSLQHADFRKLLLRRCWFISRAGSHVQIARRAALLHERTKAI